jgi:3-deoxy-D-manno-octulosonic-acid transferase
VVVNGRLSARSLRRYELVAPLLRPTFRRLTAVAAQTAAHAERFRAMGVPAERITVTGTMKWDTAEIADDVDGAAALAEALGIDRGRPLVVAGSTAGDEHELLHRAVPSGVQLLCAPRKPEWFDDAARALPGCARRSRGDRGSATDRYLLDTIGELRRAYALADVVVVGRSFGALHGSDMMEPVALGKPVIVGPRVEDFRDAVDALLGGGGLMQVDREGLAPALRALLDDPARCARLAAAGRSVIRAQQGATERHAALIRAIVARTRSSAS